MTSPAGDHRERLVALLVAGVAVVLLVSSPTWFASDRVGVGAAQLFLGAVLAAVAAFLHRRAQRR
jgi:F0F1-type ATP synthase assembly protein I